MILHCFSRLIDFFVSRDIFVHFVILRFMFGAYSASSLFCHTILNSLQYQQLFLYFHTTVISKILNQFVGVNTVSLYLDLPSDYKINDMKETCLQIVLRNTTIRPRNIDWQD